MIKKALMFMVSTFLIGNTIAWFSGAAPIHFEKIPYSESDIELKEYLIGEMNSMPNDTDIQLKLGQLYSQHNELKKAEALLYSALSADPNNMLAKAAYYANDGKLAGEMIDLSMGIYKLIRLKTAMRKIDQAAEQANDDIQVRLTRLITFAHVGKIGGQFSRVFDDEKWFLDAIESQQESLPLPIQQLVYISLAYAYQLEESEPSVKSIQYYRMATALGDCPRVLSKSCHFVQQHSVAMGGL